MPNIKVHRGIGILYSAFASWVFLSVLADRYIYGGDLFIPLDFITIGCIVVFVLSIFIETKLMKILQVSMILLVSCAILIQGNYYLSLALFTNSFFIMYSYGAFSQYGKFKIVMSIIAVYAMFAVSSLEISSGLVSMLNWLVFIVVHITSIWLVFRATVDKAHKFDESKEMQLNHKIDEMTEELHKTQEKLGDAVASGLELLKIVKEIKNGKR